MGWLKKLFLGGDSRNLWDAVRTGDIDIVRSFWSRHSDGTNALEPRNGKKYGTALWVAASEGYPDIVKFLLENNASPNQAAGHDQSTPLHAVARGVPQRVQERLVIVEMLIAHGADPLATDTFRKQPLDYAKARPFLWPLLGTLMQPNNHQIVLDNNHPVIKMLDETGWKMNDAARLFKEIKQGQSMDSRSSFSAPATVNWQLDHSKVAAVKAHEEVVEYGEADVVLIRCVGEPPKSFDVEGMVVCHQCHREIPFTHTVRRSAGDREINCPNARCGAQIELGFSGPGMTEDPGDIFIYACDGNRHEGGGALPSLRVSKIDEVVVDG